MHILKRCVGYFEEGFTSRRAFTYISVVTVATSTMIPSQKWLTSWIFSATVLAFLQNKNREGLSDGKEIWSALSINIFRYLRIKQVC